MDLALATGFRNVGTETNASVAGNANTLLSATLPNRSGVFVTNEDPVLNLNVRLVLRGATAPTYTAGRYVVQILPGATAQISASQSVDVYVCNSSDAATTSSVTYQDYAY
jgi:hypothetical protein